MPWSRNLVALPVIGACLLLSACGGSSSKGDAPAGKPSPQEAQADAVKFAKCMREHGVDAEANTSAGGNGVGLSIHVSGGPPPGGKEEGSSNPGPPPGIEAAQRACQRYLPNEGKPPKLSPAEEAKQREDALKFARCMRSHGVDVPDPGPSGAVEIEGSDVNPQSATFQNAQKACQGLMGKAPLRLSSRVGPGGGQVQSETARAGG
ncbi:MAG TPA: hypothetical protein VGF95_02065 [Solirubrobacteraceae bacterium]|jgi:hypothetical protein